MDIHHLDHTDSTMDEARRHLKNNPHLAQEKQPFLITANTQSHGRGRAKRVWHSEDGGLYMTLVLFPKPHHPLCQDTTMKIGKTVQTALIKQTNCPIEVEWPNDLILNDKKCGGILVESSLSSKEDTPNSLYIGIGINLNQTSFPDEIRFIATSLRQNTKIEYNKKEIAENLATELVHAFERNSWCHHIPNQ